MLPGSLEPQWRSRTYSAAILEGIQEGAPRISFVDSLNPFDMGTRYSLPHFHQDLRPLKPIRSRIFVPTFFLARSKPANLPTSHSDHDRPNPNLDPDAWIRALQFESYSLLLNSSTDWYELFRPSPQAPTVTLGFAPIIVAMSAPRR